MPKGAHTAPKGVKHFLGALSGTITSYAGGWSDTDITSGHSSKNIPVLFAAGDALIAYKKKANVVLDRIATAMQGYLDRAHTSGAFHAEEFSTIYSRWIFVPLLVIWNTLISTNREPADELRLFLRSVVSLAALSSSPQPQFKRSKWSKWPNKFISATPYTLFGGPRSWVRGKGDDNKRSDDDHISWHDADSMCELMDHMLGNAIFNSSGDGFVGDSIKLIKNRWRAWNPLTAVEEDIIGDLLVDDWNKKSVDATFDYIQQYPIGPARGAIEIVRDSHGNVVTLYTVGYKYGSTSFMQFKEYAHDTKQLFALGVADPKRRSNGEASTAQLYQRDGSWFIAVTPLDGTYFDMDKLRDITSTLKTRTKVSGYDWLYHGTFTKNSVTREYIDGEPDIDEPDQPGEPDMKDDTLDKIVDFIVKYLEESGILDKLIEKLLERLLGSLGKKL